MCFVLFKQHECPFFAPSLRRAPTMLIALSALSIATAMPPQFLPDLAETKNFTLGRPVQATIAPDGQSVFFLRAEARSTIQLLYRLDIATQKTSLLLSPEMLLGQANETLSVEEKARRERMRVTAKGFASFSLSADGTQILVSLSGKLFVYRWKEQKVVALNTEKGACLDAKFSPDGRLVGYVRDFDVRVIEVAKNIERRVTRGGTATKTNGLAEFVAQEEMDRFSGFWFSPDSRSVVFQTSDHTGVERFSVADPMHPERESDRFFYPRPGQKNAVVTLSLVTIGKNDLRTIEWSREAFPYLATVRWSEGAPLTVLVQNRAQTKEQLLRVDEKTGRTAMLLEETDSAWLNLDQHFPLWKPDGTGFFWMTEKSGSRDIELRHADGTLERLWAQNIETAVEFDNVTQTLFVLAGRDSTEIALHAARPGEVLRRVRASERRSLEMASSFSKAHDLVAVTHRTLEQSAQTDIVKLSGELVATLPSVAEIAKAELQVQIQQLPNNGAMAMVLRPESFAKGKKYPVILWVYGGPHHSEVTHDRDRLWLAQWFANQGYLVVKFDGRGTPRRGRNWERAIQGDFATPIASDQVTHLQTLSQQVPEMDLTRVGVYGWSFGGYLAALLTMSHPEAIKAGVAGAPVVDWRDYDTHYTERYLGMLPEAQKAYEVSSLLSYVEGAKRPLLLIHGTADDNVYFMHSLKLSNALFRAGKAHSVLPLANFTHMVPEPLVTQRLNERILQHFKDNL